MLIIAHTLEIQYITLKSSRFVNEWGWIWSKCWWFCSSAVMRSWGNVGMRSTRSVLSSPFWCTPWGTCCQTDIKRFPLCSLFCFHGYCIDLHRNSNWYINLLSNSVVTVFAQVLSETTRRNTHGNTEFKWKWMNYPFKWEWFLIYKWETYWHVLNKSSVMLWMNC